MRKQPLFGILGLAVLATSLQAVVPQKWELRTREDYLRGKFDGLSVSYDGMLALAPKEERIAAPQEEFYLSVLVTPDGTTFLGTGHGGKVYRIGKDGKSEVWFQAPEMDVTSLAQDKKGVLYASTSPNGRIYKITGSGNLGPPVPRLGRTLGGRRRERRDLPDLAARRGPDVLQGRRKPHLMPRKNGPGRCRRGKRR
jgi:hypothetical protein